MERLATETIFNGSESIIPMADVVFISRDKRPGYIGAVTVVLKGSTYNPELGDYNNALWLRKEEADVFLKSWCQYRSEVDLVQKGPGEAPAPPPDPMAFRAALETAFGHAAHIQMSFHHVGTKAEHVDRLTSQALLLLPGARLERQRGETAWWTLVERADIRFAVYGDGPIPDGWAGYRRPSALMSEGEEG